LRDFGVGDAGLTLAGFSTPGPIVQLGVHPNRIDLLTTVDGVIGRPQDPADIAALEDGGSDGQEPS
jgi:hypothetical protein